LSEIKDIVAWVSLLDGEVTWLVLFFGEWHDLGQSNWSTLFLGEVDVVSINNDVLSEISFTGKTCIMWD
jgi:hypothetical protein